MAEVTPSRSILARNPAVSSISARRIGTSAPPVAQVITQSEIQASKEGEELRSVRSSGWTPIIRAIDRPRFSMPP